MGSSHQPDPAPGMIRNVGMTRGQARLREAQEFILGVLSKRSAKLGELLRTGADAAGLTAEDTNGALAVLVDSGKIRLTSDHYYAISG